MQEREENEELTVTSAPHEHAEPSFVVRAEDGVSYQPANHTGTVNRRLIGPNTVGATNLRCPAEPSRLTRAPWT